MKDIKEELKAAAVEQYGSIEPCGDKTHLDQCFTVADNKILFWFNVGNDTRILHRDLHENQGRSQ